MKILVVGAGLSGCSIARLLADRKHDVTVIEKTGKIGGLCVTEVDANGINYEPYGARTFHTKDQKIIDFAKKFDDFSNYIHRKGVIINERIFPFPFNIKSLDAFKNKNKIAKELSLLTGKIDKTNFETACISVFGKTLYKYFIENYSRKMWGLDPKKLTSEWAPKRLELRVGDKDWAFEGQWQGLPKHGYTYWIKNMVNGINLHLNCSVDGFRAYDVVVTTAPLDETLNYRFGKLTYRSLLFDYKTDEDWENDSYGTINLPQHKKYIRKCNFKVLHQQKIKHNLVQYQQPIDYDEKNVPMYPVNTAQNDSLFDKYLYTICQSENICPSGRLGLYRYLDMDKAIAVSYYMLPIIERYLHMSAQQRYYYIKKVINKCL